MNVENPSINSDENQGAWMNGSVHVQNPACQSRPTKHWGQKHIWLKMLAANQQSNKKSDILTFGLFCLIEQTRWQQAVLYLSPPQSSTVIATISISWLNTLSSSHTSSKNNSAARRSNTTSIASARKHKNDRMTEWQYRIRTVNHTILTSLTQ